MPSPKAPIHSIHPTDPPQTYGSRQHDARYEYGRHVYAAYGQYERGEVGYDRNPFDGLPLRSGGHFRAAQQVEPEHGCGGRDRDRAVHPELVAHAAFLGAGRGDRRVGDERQVVAEERSPDDNGYDHRRFQTGSLGYAERDGRQRDDRADRRFPPRAR